MGWETSRTTWFTQGSGPGPDGATTRSGFDRFGRPGTITRPDGTTTELTYAGDRVVSRALQVATSHDATSSVWSTELYDAHGRLVEVCDGATSAWSGSCSGQRTTYSYDEADRLVSVCQGASGTSCGQQRSFSYDGRGFLTSETHPELGGSGNGRAESTYDSRGNVLTKDIAGPSVDSDHELRYRYDRAGRLIRLEERPYFDSPPSNGGWRPLKEFFYARKNRGSDLRAGKLVMARRTNWLEPLSPLTFALVQIPVIVTDHFTYADRGGLVSRKRTSITVGPGTSSFTSTYHHDRLGNVRYLTYPECQGWPCRDGRPAPARTVAFDYRYGYPFAIGDPLTLPLESAPDPDLLGDYYPVSDGTFLVDLRYQLGGLPHQVEYGNGVTWTQTPDEDGMSRPQLIQTTGVVGAAVADPQAAGNWSTSTYSYDGAGNVSGIGLLSYTYDAFHRLLEEKESFAVRQTATYDGYGNLTQLHTNGATQPMATSASTNRLIGGQYDGSGNLEAISLGESQEMDYDGASMLKSLQTPTGVRLYVYDASDERVMRWDCPLDLCGPDTSREHITLRGLSGEVLRIFEGTERADRRWKEDTIYNGSQPVIRIENTGEGTEAVQALHHDHLGSIRQVTNWQGQQVSRHRYYPFGQEATPSSTTDPVHKFTGHERDPGFQASTPLDYMHARYCSPVLGRFLSVDPARASASQRTPQSWNRYAYVRNNPLRFNDPDGRKLRLAQDRRTRRKVRPILIQTLRRPGGRAIFSKLAASDITFTVGYGRLTSAREIHSIRRNEGGQVRLRSGENRNMVIADGKIVSIDIAIDTNAIAVHPVDTSGVATMAHEGVHGVAISKGQDDGLPPNLAWAEGVKGDLPSSETGPAAEQGRAVFEEEVDLSTEDAEEFLDELTADPPS